MRNYLIRTIIQKNQEKLEWLVKSNMISRRILSSLEEDPSVSLDNLIMEKKRIQEHIVSIDDMLVEYVQKLKKVANLSEIAMMCDEDGRDMLRSLKESTFRVLKKMDSNRKFDKRIARELFTYLK